MCVLENVIFKIYRGSMPPDPPSVPGHTFRLAGSPGDPLRAACGQSQRSFAGLRAVPEILCGLNDSESRFILLHFSLGQIL